MCTMDLNIEKQDNFQKRNEEFLKKTTDALMTSSTLSNVSSLASPVDSGVQMLDSESDLTSVMSNNSGCETDTGLQVKPSDTEPEESRVSKIYDQDVSKQEAHAVLSQMGSSCRTPSNSAAQRFTESDFVNKNVVVAKLSQSVPNDYFDRFREEANKPKCSMESSKSVSDEVFEMEHPIKSNTEVDLMNISLNSYELLDYTLQNTVVKLPPDSETATDMHVSLSEEVNENLKVILDGKEAPPPITEEVIPVIENPETKPVEEQIVFRRLRKKKSKSDTPKKRVSFHEDILNSTKIDDIHINLGFVTHEPDVSLSFFQRGFIRKPDVVKGRYSWAAEGDAPFYEKPDNNREIKSDIYVQHPRAFSSSSSSTGSASSSIDEEDDSGSDENVLKKEPSLKQQPKSSCLKKTKHRKYIDTKIVQEETINLKKKKSETNLLLDGSNIFGSLKNILTFSTSVPLAERGVPEGQEDVAVYSSSHDLSNRRKSVSSFSFQSVDTVEVEEVKPEPVSKINLAKTNLKLTKSEGFYPNYPHQEVPANIILCDSNVYEHKGISYSYEYDNFQKTFEQQIKPKSSQMYRKILNDFNFFRRKAKEEPSEDVKEDFEIIDVDQNPNDSDLKVEEVEEVEVPEREMIKTANTSRTSLSKYASSTRLDWSDNETVSDFSESRQSRHLDSPKRRGRRSNHYTVQTPFKIPLSEKLPDNLMDSTKSLPNLRPSSSKSSLINRFLRNVTLKKMLDIKAQNNAKRTKTYLSLYPKNCGNINTDRQLDETIEQEVIRQKEKKTEEPIDMTLVYNLKKQIFKNRTEEILKVFPVRSAYTTNGDSKPLLFILTNRAVHVVSSKSNAIFTSNFVLPYTDLNAILIGPSAQTIHLSNYDLDMQCILTTGCSKITNELVGRLEMAMRRDSNRPQLPAVKHLSMRDMANLRRAICKQTTVNKDEEYYYYSIVSIQDSGPEEMSTPLGPSKEGPLMFKTTDCDTGRWETAYFILKAGVLYMLSSASQKVPMRVFPLINGACEGARRIFTRNRPHTFQLTIEGNILNLAAPDEYVASEWLQELIHAASGIYNIREKDLTHSCSLLMTSDHILTVREAFPCTVSSLLPSGSNHQPIKGPQALSCAAITDLVTFRLPSAEQSWCVLEFSCREVHEYSGDWIIYFSTNAELEHFISTLEMLWQYGNEEGDSFPLSTIPENDPLSKKCVNVYKSLIESWPQNTVHLQFM